ncbi:hypothetical protein [Corynebacterium heidelbergense]|uniref:hypothetical protein n=1 Tax=Corynebacterium heidelbergense TaxID=2055947 RepID=UPI001057B08D|nr:hypothetical protein [Corynebacterium heidelbergense]
MKIVLDSPKGSVVLVDPLGPADQGGAFVKLTEDVEPTYAGLWELIDVLMMANFLPAQFD